MKTVLIICAIICTGIEAHNVHLSHGQQEKVKEYTAECIKESGAKPEVLAAAKKGHLIDDEGLKKFIFCFFQKTGILSHDAKLNTDVALSKLPSGIDKVTAAKVLNDCKNKKGATHPDTAFEIFKCYYSHTKQHILFEQ